MKRLKIYTILITSIFTMISCLEDKRLEDQEYGLLKEQLETKKIIEIPSNANHTFAKAYLAEGEQSIVVGEVRLAANNPASENITVKLKKVDKKNTISLIRKYQRKRYPKTVPDEDIHIFESSEIQIPETVTIPAGKQSVPLKIKIDTNSLKAGSTFFVINVASVNEGGYIVSGNFNNLILDLKLKSKYEGEYEYKVESNLGGNPGKVYLSTVSPTKVKFNLINKYSNEVFYIIDPTTNKVTVECPSLGADTTFGEYYPKTKSFHVIWSGRGGKYTFDETFTLVK